MAANLCGAPRAVNNRFGVRCGSQSPTARRPARGRATYGAREVFIKREDDACVWLGHGAGARRRRARRRRPGHRAARRRRRPGGRPRRPGLRGEPERASRTPGRCAACAGAPRPPGAAFGASRALMRSSAADRAVDAGVAADGSGLIVVQSARGARRGVRAVAFGPRGRLGRPQALSAPGARADFAASAVAPSGAAVVVWFRHRGARWRLEAATREPGARAVRRRPRRSRPSCAARAARACPSRSGRAATPPRHGRRPRAPRCGRPCAAPGSASARRGSSPATRATRPGSSSATAAPSR